MNPQPPRLYDLIKLHKNLPFLFLCLAFNNVTCFNFEHSILNSVSLVNKIKDIHVPTNSKLVSFDV